MISVFQLFTFTASWLLIDTLEKVFEEFIISVLPIYHQNLLNTRNLRNYVSNVGCLINALYCTLFSLHAMYFGWSLPLPSLVYFLYDFYKGCTPTMALHHVLALMLICFVTYQDEEETSVVAPYVLFSEFSTVFLAIGGIIHGAQGLPRNNLAVQEKLLLHRIKNIFYLTFIVTRMVILPYAIVVMMHNPGSRHYIAMSMLGTLQLMNIIWFTKIFKKLTGN